MNCQNIVNTLKTYSLGLFTDQRKGFFFVLWIAAFPLTFLVQEVTLYQLEGSNTCFFVLLLLASGWLANF